MERETRERGKEVRKEGRKGKWQITKIPNSVQIVVGGGWLYMWSAECFKGSGSITSPEAGNRCMGVYYSCLKYKCYSLMYITIF